MVDWALGVMEKPDGSYCVWIGRYTYRPDDPEGEDPDIETRTVGPTFRTKEDAESHRLFLARPRVRDAWREQYFHTGKRPARRK